MLNKLLFFFLLLVGIAILLPVIFTPLELTLGWDMPLIQKSDEGIHFIDVDFTGEDAYSYLFWCALTMAIIGCFVVYQSWKQLFYRKQRHF